MANTTFSGPVRSENGFKTIVKSASTGAITNEMTFSQYTATVTVADVPILTATAVPPTGLNAITSDIVTTLGVASPFPAPPADLTIP